MSQKTGTHLAPLKKAGDVRNSVCMSRSHRIAKLRAPPTTRLFYIFQARALLQEAQNVLNFKIYCPTFLSMRLA